VVNAVADALAPFGVRITDLPLTPDAVLTLIDPALREEVGA
jgi:carbon-monoxide dehydrogenase large subunit